MKAGALMTNAQKSLRNEPLNVASKKDELMAFLHQHVFEPVLDSPKASKRLKDGVRLTIMRMQRLEPASMRQYYWSAIIGTGRSIRFADEMRREGFTRFEDIDILDDFRRRFDDEWLRS